MILKTRKRTIAFVLALLALVSLIGCYHGKEGTSDVPDSTVPPYNDDPYTDNLPARDYEGAVFRIYTYDSENMICPTLEEEISSDVVSESIYYATMEVEERFKIDLVEILVDDGSLNTFMSPAQAGSYEYDIGNMRAEYALTMWTNDLSYTYDELTYVDLDKAYWNQTANESLKLNNTQYAAIGGYSVAAHCLVHALAFNKSIVADLTLTSPYDLVRQNSWTMETMKTMLVAATSDMDGDQIMTEQDRYGYLAHYKEILPSFWIASDVLSFEKDEDGMPYSNMTSRKFNDVFNKVFEVIYDTGSWYIGDRWNPDIPEFCVNMFAGGHSLFVDTTFFALERFRGIDGFEFGLLPYPKLDEKQREYISRVEYYNTCVVPYGVLDPERAGIVLEALNCVYQKRFLPAYYEYALQRKYTADTESREMLDIIFQSLVIDLGDTLFCSTVRDGFLAKMFLNNNRNISSELSKNTGKIQVLIDSIENS